MLDGRVGASSQEWLRCSFFVLGVSTGPFVDHPGCVGGCQCLPMFRVEHVGCHVRRQSGLFMFVISALVGQGVSLSIARCCLGAGWPRVFFRCVLRGGWGCLVWLMLFYLSCRFWRERVFMSGRRCCAVSHLLVGGSSLVRAVFSVPDFSLGDCAVFSKKFQICFFSVVGRVRLIFLVVNHDFSSCIPQIFHFEIHPGPFAELTWPPERVWHCVRWISSPETEVLR